MWIYQFLTVLVLALLWRSWFWCDTSTKTMTIKKFILFSVQPAIGTVFMMTLFIHRSLSTSGITSYHELYLRYSTNSGERESRTFHEEPETSVSILISTTVLHLYIFVMHSALPARPQPLVRSLQFVEVWPYSEEEEEEEEEVRNRKLRTGIRRVYIRRIVRNETSIKLSWRHLFWPIRYR